MVETVEAKVYQKFYAKLTEGLPIDFLLPEFVTKDLLTVQCKRRVESRTTPQERTQCFLDEAITPGLSIGFTEPFNSMLNIMESCDWPIAKYLAKQMKGEMKEYQSVFKLC